MERPDNNDVLGPAKQGVPALIALAGQPPMVVDAPFHLGTACSATGRTIGVDSRSLWLEGKPWLPVMGEFHYARYPRAEWRNELLKMKLGGIDIVASYIFWIHHEEVEGDFDWSCRRSLREFVELCGEIGLYCVVRCGPWCHGECRNGGLPDWLLSKGLPTRSNDPAYLSYVRRLYLQISHQLEGLLFKDGGPVIGMQCENEYGGPAEHLLTLKRIALDVGIDVPLYTRTGWPSLAAPLPQGELLPLFGGYPDGFWDRSIDEMPPAYRENYLFRTVRTEIAAGADRLGIREAKDDPDIGCYPYFACEIGGGMVASYHRRIRIAPKDIEGLALAKIGSGNNLQGYYMYHGGANPEARLTTLQESQATGYWNDLPVKSYDFQAPLGEFGQVREHYHSLRRLHLFLRDFGSELATMPMRLPEERPADAADLTTLRWAIRTNGRAGFLFVNNYQRLQPMPSVPNTQFQLSLAKGDLRLPARPVTIPADSSFFWPFNLDIEGIRLVWATAQPICRLADDLTTYLVFGETEGISPEFVFDAKTVSVERAAGTCASTENGIRVSDIHSGTEAAIHLVAGTGESVIILLLSAEQSLACWKSEFLGRERLFITRASLLIDGDSLRLHADDQRDLAISILPAPAQLLAGEHCLRPEPDGLFGRFAPTTPSLDRAQVAVEQVHPAGAARPIRIGSQGVAEAPTDSDFESAAVWRIGLPVEIDHKGDTLLRITYVGDVARVYLDGKLIADNFYNGAPFEIGLERFAPHIYGGELLLKVLPLVKDAAIYLPHEARPDFGNSDSAIKLLGIDITSQHEVALTSAENVQPVSHAELSPTGT